MAKLLIMGVAQDQETRAPPATVRPKRTDPTEQVSHLFHQDHLKEIEIAIAKILKADEDLMKLDEQIQPLIDDPWDRLDAAPLIEQRLRIEGIVYLAVTDISAHGTYLKDLSSIDVPSDVIERVAVEQPGCLTHDTWQRLVGVPCPF